MSSPDWYTPVSSLPGLVSGVRAAVDSTVRDAAWRRAQLRGVRSMITENREALIAAVAADLGRPTQEIVLFELNTITDEVDEVRAREPAPQFSAFSPFFLRISPRATLAIARCRRRLCARRRWPTSRRGWRTKCWPCPRRSCPRTPS